MTNHFHVLSSFKPAGTNSFRYASGQFLGDYGCNLQNPDKEALDIFVVTNPLESFVQCDQSGAEALVVAHLARPGNYRRLFEVGIKPHTFVAMHIFIEQYADRWPLDGKPPAFWKALTPDELKAQPGWKALDKAIKNSGVPYKVGKMTCHASSYRMGPRTFQLQSLKQSHGTLVLSIADCELFLRFFRELFPEIVEWQDEIEFTIRRSRTLRNLFGYPRRFERPITDSYIREGISWIPQSTVGVITHRAIRRYNSVRDNLLRPAINNKHDSFLTISPDDRVREVAALMQDCLAARLIGRDGIEFIMRSEAQVGKHWGGYDEELSPLGMRELK